MRVGVTGASGFCGGVVARAAAAAGHDVVCLGRRPGPVGTHRRWDAAREIPDLAGVDVVLHLAAAVGDPRPGRAAEAAYTAVNVDGTRRLLGALGGRPLVWVSSASVYARPEPGRAVTETHPTTGGRSVYGRTKAAGDRLALDAGAVVLRPRAVYGPGDPHLLPRLRRALRGRTLLLPGPDIRLSLTSVDNLAAACLAAAGLVGGRFGEGWPGGAYNVADAEDYSRDAVVRAVLGRDVRIRHVPVGVARVAAAVAVRVFPGAALTPYSVDQLVDGVVLDIARARAAGYTPGRSFGDYVLPGDGPHGTTRVRLRAP